MNRENLRTLLNGIRVLVVEDEGDTRNLLAFLLEQHGATVMLADNVTYALKCFQESRPDVILADIGMPGLNGYALIASIRKQEGTGTRRPAIALTAYSTPADRDIALTSGFTEYLSKPFEPRELLATIRRLYDAYRAP